LAQDILRFYELYVVILRHGIVYPLRRIHIPQKKTLCVRVHNWIKNTIVLLVFMFLLVALKFWFAGEDVGRPSNFSDFGVGDRIHKFC
jgi:hypothetical protein